jgi:RecA-family ATPase
MTASAQAMTAATLQDAIAALNRLGCKPTKSGDGYTAFCPIHEADGQGHKPSLTLKTGDTVPVVVNCHAGCDGTAILKALNITPAPSHNSKKQIAATYSYHDPDGHEVLQKIRYKPKDFRIRHRDAAGNWIYKAGDGPAVLYRLPEVNAAIAEGRTVFICEGEKDADRLASLGLVATCNIEGAAKPDQRPKWRPEYFDQLSGAASVVLMPDNDEPGRFHMLHAAKQLQDKVGEVRWLELPGLPEKGDVSDWLDAGGTVDKLLSLADEAPEAPRAPELPAREVDDAKLTGEPLFPEFDPEKPPPDKAAAGTLAGFFKDRLRVDPVTLEWLLRDDRTGIFKPCPAAAVQRLVYGALDREFLEFSNAYVVGVTRLMAHEIELAQRRNDTVPPPFRPLKIAEMASASLHPRCIVENLLYADLALVNAEGGTGKTTMLLYEAVHIALGRDLWGCRVLNPGRTLFITAEDGEEILQGRLREVMAALNLTDYEQRTVCESIMIWDVTGSLVRLAELDARGNLQLTELADQIADTYRDADLAQVILDPVISFSPGERIVNDGEQAVVTACRRIVRGLNCCVRLVHHSGKANARDGAIDQYAGRGGTALPDGSRMITSLASTNRTNLAKPDGFDLQPGESGFVMARSKLSYAPPQPNIWIRRCGWTFDYFVEEPRNSDAARDRDADKVADFLTEELHHGRRYTANTLEQSGKTGLSRSRLRAALAALEVSGRVTPRDLPPELRQGGRKVYLHPLNFAEPRGEVAANTPQTDREQTPTSPAPNLAAAYREKNGGEVDAAISSSNSTTSPANIGEVPAKWRSKGKPLDSGLKSPKSGSGGDDSAENDGMNDSDQRRYSAEPRGEVGEVPDDAQPAEHGPDIPPDISSATQAESKGESSALANKAPDTPRANQQPPAADPLATRVAELIAQGWAPPNAQARARSEAMHRAKPGARS